MRDGCSSTCDDSIRTEIGYLEHSLADLGVDSVKCTSGRGSGWMDVFLEELEASLETQGYLEKQGAIKTWTSSFLQEFEDLYDGEYTLENVDLTGWLDVSKENGICDEISLIDNLFDTDLCQTTQLSQSLGTLRGLCPVECGLCGSDGVVDTSLSIFKLYFEQDSLVQSGVLRFILFSGQAAGLACDSTTLGTVTGGATVTYNFVPTGNGTVVFSLCDDGTDFDTVLELHNIDDEIVGLNDDFCGFGSQLSYTGSDSFLSIHIYGWGTATGNFALTIECNSGDAFPYYQNFPSSYQQPQHLECNSVVPASYALLHYLFLPQPDLTVVFSVCGRVELNTRMCLTELETYYTSCSNQSRIEYTGQASSLDVFIVNPPAGIFNVSTTCFGPNETWQYSDLQYGCGNVSGRHNFSR